MALKLERLKATARARNDAWGDGWLAKADGRVYAPNEEQKAFHVARARFRCLFGGRGCGKTTAGAQEALVGRIRFGLSGAVVNPDMENFKYSTWPELKQWIPWDRVVRSDRRMGEFGWEPRGNFVVHFTNGATVYCKGLKYPDAARGPNINWLWYDEGARDRTGEAFRLAIAGVRIGPSPAAWVTTTPRGRRHWTAKMFVYRETDLDTESLLSDLGLSSDRMWWWGNASIESNKENLDPAFYASMRSAYTGRFAQQELEGLVVDIEEGVVFDNFTVQNISNLADYSPSRSIPEIAYDDGFGSSPRVFLLIQMDEDGTINIFDELYRYKEQNDVTITAAKEMLVNYARKQEWPGHDGEVTYYNPPAVRFEIAVGDPSAPQLKARFRELDIPARAKASMVLDGLRHVYNLVNFSDGLPRLRVHPRCKNFIREMSEGYKYPDGSDGKPGDILPTKLDDHGPDAFRYWARIRLRRVV